MTIATRQEGQPGDEGERHDSDFELLADDESTTTNVLADDDIILVICLPYVLRTIAVGQLDGRSLRGPITEYVVVRTNFFTTLKAQRSRTVYKKTLRCSPESFDALQELLEPMYYHKYGLPGQNTQYNFDIGLDALLTYYGNGCGIDGDGIRGAAAQLGMSRTVAGVYIKRLENLLNEMMPSVIFFPDPFASDEWDALVNGFVEYGSDYADVAIVFDGTIVQTRRPRNHIIRAEFYDKSGNTSYNCLAAIDYWGKSRYCGVFSGSNSNQSMWNQSEILGSRARYLCPPGINWLADACFKMWPFLMVPLDERRGNRLTRKQRWRKLLHLGKPKRARPLCVAYMSVGELD
ncbi:hypothetical protein PHMEG_00024817 [Phytophthora megakarya]|uniref:DDE Tnp4 domain-containing protein n=1 Tax=Phytophthora megakarya TaxID=4795 RepID=A0A225VDR5_9STRA|nr:hypothetical protein PHMEG_00024817 [Phytophthora megakarya]